MAPNSSDPEPSSLTCQSNGHCSNSQELLDQELATSHTAPQVALMEGGRFVACKRFSFVYSIRFRFWLTFWKVSKDCFYTKLNINAVCKESLQKIVKRDQKNDITPGSIPHATLKITQTTWTAPICSWPPLLNRFAQESPSSQNWYHSLSAKKSREVFICFTFTF